MVANLDPKTKALKLVVIVMSVLIVVCLAIVVVTIYNRANRMVAAPREFEPISLGLPAQCEVAELAAAEGRVYLRLAPVEGCPLAIVLDAASGEPIGRIER